MEIARIEIPKHIREVQMSLSQRARYFEWTGITIKARKCILPRSFFRDKNNYPDKVLIEDLKQNFSIALINHKGKVIDYIKDNIQLPRKLMPKEWKYILYDSSKGWEPVIANPKKVGTPSTYLINGQHIYSGVLKDFQLGKVIGAIKECYKPYIKNLPVITEYPIDICCEVHDTIKSFYIKKRSKIGDRWDMDNYTYPYLKSFPDLLVAEGKIRDDDRLHIPGTIGATFHPIEDHSNRKLVFIISKTTRPEIINNEIYKSYHKNPETFETEDLDLIKEDDEDKGYTVFTNINNYQKEKLKQAKDLFNQDNKEDDN